MTKSKILIAALASLGIASVGSTALAYTLIQDSGPYIGAQGGWSDADYGSDIKNFFRSFPSHSVSENGFGGRLYAGWQLNPVLSVEGGYTQFANNKYSANFSPIFGSYNGDLKLKTNAWDIVGKATLPLSDLTQSLTGFDIYGKAGAAYVTSKAEENLTAAVLNTAVASDSETVHGWEPVAGVGVGYDFNNGLNADVSYTRIFGHKTSLNDDNLQIPSTNLVAIGVSYRFDLFNMSSQTTASNV